MSTNYPQQLEHGPYLDKSFPEVYKALALTYSTLGQELEKVGLPQDLVELVLVRASQINGCATCLSIHAPQARKAGVSEVKLDVLNAWRETDIFSVQERAALDLTEALTILPTGARAADAPLKALEVFSPEQVAALGWAIALINAFNRVSLASGHPVKG
ncbi:carboxymuconolactone decarboxylase family protein [Corynebacterium felinum]|uniref:AhpD family alkylhydroperoxidase n=1 Tax=Corynebacterium felinum TaxID=131318 RepID=A0ABU2B7V0_9CORY|nr:carboxymuconolactone decarboxylase family protein [Corynebacterium felinum]MDF5821638.1 carboxymuconolactone decarboxylase family protein [Corynebacterium felinum]MDR7354683.1 AhpD family alkylhydroperoxidase [Corynebacterium felinum]WJY94047.1 Carboxymuconolactone decarboxylase family protein [Corynebacterium felinum]